MVVFGEVFVAVESLGGPLGPDAVPDSPRKRFHEGDTRRDNAKVDFESTVLDQR